MSIHLLNDCVSMLAQFALLRICSLLSAPSRMRIILGYDPSDMMSSNAFAFFHPGDLSPEHIMNAHQQRMFIHIYINFLI